MKLRIMCLACGREAIRQSKHPPLTEIAIEYVNGQSLIGTCPNGHTGKVAVQEKDFEILFDMGGMAFLDGYAREAVTSFAAALERAMSFYVATVLRDVGCSEDDIADFSRTIGNRSEREAGAFVSLYYFIERMKPPLLANPLIEFRNNCVHKGAIPSAEETLNFGQSVMEIIDHIIEVLRAKHETGLNKSIGKHMQEQIQGNEELARWFYSVNTMVSLILIPNQMAHFSERLKELKRYRASMWTV